jgi:peptidyl-prolyl cis-trans isomerase C
LTRKVLVIAIALALLAACGGTPSPAPVPGTAGPTAGPGTAGATTQPQPGPTTAVPLAARVNGVDITLEAYQRAVARCEAAEASLGHDPAQSDCRTRTLDELIERVLVQNEAATMGLAVTDADVDALVQSIKQEQSAEAFAQWLAISQYRDEAELREDLRAQMLGSKIFEKVTAGVPATAEQIHARHILLASEADAQNVLAQLQAGADFAQLAQQYSLDESTRATGGDLGFFYRGLLTVPEVENAAFDLQPGQISGIVQSARGFHIIQVLERDPQAPLAPDDLLRVRQQAFERWLADLWAKAQVEKYVNPGP